MFPDHFQELNADDGRGFGVEYEALAPVGTQQKYEASLLPGNQAKNRFNSILPYDWSRVKLTKSKSRGTSDYINANYMPNSSSKVRMVRQIHFKVWPDHGVPEGTRALIQFRDLMRSHVEGGGAKGGPTVVHSSGGVGRTGTLIALDFLLQQLELKGSVSVSNVVHNMRLSRDHMVQTESQYVFLHQCIMGRLQQEKPDHCHVYENRDVIYATAAGETRPLPRLREQRRELRHSCRS